MAILKLKNGRLCTKFEDIAQELVSLNIQLNYWTIRDNIKLRCLLLQNSLNKEEKEQVLKDLDAYFKQLQQTAGYKTRDLIVLHPNIPNLYGILAKFGQIHTHTEDEVRYIIDGEGIFGFVLPDKSQVELTVQPEECINVPAGTEHWFYLTSIRRIKVVRYFTGTEGWIPQYTSK